MSTSQRSRGTGPDGRITEDDVRGGSTENGARHRAADQVASSARGGARAAGGDPAGDDVPHGRLHGARGVPRRARASRRCRSSSPRSSAPSPITRSLNAAWADDGTSPRDDVHVGIAVDTERGLVVPVIHDAAAAQRSPSCGARSNASPRPLATDTCAPSDLAGATIAVSNTGSYGSEAGTPILSPGTSVTLALGVIQPRALVVDGAGGGAARRHDLDDVRPSRAGRRRRRARPDRSRGAARVARTAGRAASVKIASLLPSATEIVYALGLGDDLVGVTDECDYPPAAVTKPVISRSALSQGHLQTPREIDDAVRDKVGAGEPHLPARRRPAPPDPARRDPHAGPLPRLRGAERAGAAGARQDRPARREGRCRSIRTRSTRSSPRSAWSRSSLDREEKGERDRRGAAAARRDREGERQAAADDRGLRAGVVRSAVLGRPLDPGHDHRGRRAHRSWPRTGSRAARPRGTRSATRCPR